jgi:putative ABC transport system permease protein
VRGILLLTCRYLSANKLKTAILLVCLTATFFLPLALKFLIARFEQDLLARGNATPLVVGVRGDRFDLVLKTLYFNSDSPGEISASDFDDLQAEGRGLVIPMHADYSARDFPVVGTSLEYFEFRGLRPAQGSFPLRLGDAILGANVARALRLGVGDPILTDQESLYNIAAIYPLKMRITGILGERGTPDDDAIFTDVKTSWVIAGIGHGHTDVTEPGKESLLLDKSDEAVVASAAVVEYNEITDANIGSFHFHADRGHLPLTSLIYLPDSSKSATILKGRFNVSKTLQMLEPRVVLEELMGIVFQVKRFFDGSFLLVFATTALFLVLVVLLSLKLRERERQALFRIGCSRGAVFCMQATELLALVVVSALLAGAGALGLAEGLSRLVLR